VLKTPAYQEVAGPLERLALDALARHKLELEAWKQEQMIVEFRREAAKAELKKRVKGGADEDELLELARQAREGEEELEPVAKRYLTSDSTIEKLGVLLNENPNGMLLLRDELIGFLRVFDRQGHEQDRPFFLESWPGNGFFSVDRMGRPSLHIPALCISIFGNANPGPLARYLRGTVAGNEADGFIPRFQILVYPDPRGPFQNHDRRPDVRAKRDAYGVFQAIDGLYAQAKGAEVDADDWDRHEEAPEDDMDSGVGGLVVPGLVAPERAAAGPLPYLRFDAAAQEFFNDWRVGLEERLGAGSLDPAMEAHLAKYRSLMPALALQLHVIERVAAPQLGPVPLLQAQAAAAWCDLLESHARRVYRSAQEGDIEAAASLAERIKKGRLPNPFRPAKDVARKGWAGLATAEEAWHAVSVLENYNWVKVVEIPPGPKGGRPDQLVYINPFTPADKEGQS
jgi:putative DNA primase/helicase